jgi:SAM-dependent methyltransferase
MNVFSEIYEKSTWGFGSGHGSLPSATEGYRNFLQAFLRQKNIKSVVDYGCGDWQFTRLIDWSNIKYWGLDLVPSVISENTRQFRSDNIKFQLIEAGTPDVPRADLLIVKDVLQHLPDNMVREILNTLLPRFKFALITNCIHPVELQNKPIQAGGFRPLDIRIEPFNFPGREVFRFRGPRVFAWKKFKFFPAWEKCVLLLETKSAPPNAESS